MKAGLLLRILFAVSVCFAVLVLRREPLTPVVHAHGEIDTVTPAAAATIVAKRSGNWSDDATWGGRLPERSARVLIPEGMSVTVDGELPERYDWVRVDGTLRFAPDTNTSLTLETLAVEHNGTLEIGTAREPITARAVVTFQHRGELIDHIYDPLELSRGLVATGRVEMHGQPKASWVSVSQPPEAGSLWISADRVPPGWAEGDTVILTAPNFGESETFQIVAIEESGIRLDHPIAYARPFPVDPRTNQPYEGLSLHLGNLTRNVVVRTHPDHAGQRGLQGHVMLMHRGGHAIRYAAFEDLGRTTIDPVTDPLVGPGGTRDPSLCPPGITAENVRGRYALHFHMATPFSEQSVVEGTAVVVKRGSRLKIGFINHSSNVVFKDNVGVNIDGSTFFTEEGDEVGAFIDNLAIYSVGSNNPTDMLPGGNWGGGCPDVYNRRRLDVGHKGHGFWIHGGGTRFSGNVAAEHGASGFIVWTRPLDFRITNTFKVLFPVALIPQGGPWVGSGKESVGIDVVPSAFENNIAYVLGHDRWGGIAGFEINFHLKDQAQKFPNSPKNLFSGNLAWNVRGGVQATYAGWTTYERVRFIRGDLFGLRETRSVTVGMNLAPQGGNHNIVRDVQLEGFAMAIRPSVETIFENVMVDGQPYVPAVSDPSMPPPGAPPAPGPGPAPPPPRTRP
jgi:hypothetical protein